MLNYNKDLEIKRLKSLCWFYIATTAILLITTLVFLFGWLDLVNFISNIK
jgi:hypothetical protein